MKKFKSTIAPREGIGRKRDIVLLDELRTEEAIEVGALARRMLSRAVWSRREGSREV